MDFVAIQKATDEDLEVLGLTKKGDLFALRSFVDCNTASQQVCEERVQKKKKLLQLAKEIKTSRQKDRHGNSESNMALMASELGGAKKPKCNTRKIQVGWLHYDSSKKKYISVRYCKGGGSRELFVNLNAGTRDIIKSAKELFFPDGKSFHGSAIDMTFTLGRFDCTVIEAENFCIGKYISDNKLTRVRLYLMSKHDEESSSDELPEASFVIGKSAIKDHVNRSTAYDSTCSNGDSLVGTSAEKALLRQQKNEDLQSSLEEDKAKNGKESEETAKVETLRRQQCLQRARELRVPAAPSPGIPYVRVSVRHPSVGVQTRSFCEYENMAAVYDWAGSLALTPELFILSKCDVPGILFPDLSVTAVDKHLLSMIESDSMPSYPGNQIDFLGFGSNVTEHDALESLATPFCETLPALWVVVENQEK